MSKILNQFGKEIIKEMGLTPFQILLIKRIVVFTCLGLTLTLQIQALIFRHNNPSVAGWAFLFETLPLTILFFLISIGITYRFIKHKKYHDRIYLSYIFIIIIGCIAHYLFLMY